MDEITKLKNQLADAKKLIREQGRELGKQDIFIEELKSQIPCPECHGRGFEKRYCPTCKVAWSVNEITFDGYCMDCKTKVTDCPACRGTGKKYPEAKRN